jgi:hypothetical protein
VGVEKDCGEAGIGAGPFKEDLPSTNSRVCALSAMDLAWEMMKLADSAYWGHYKKNKV